MDRDDAAFVANVLASRTAGAREDLERYAASSFAALLAASAIIRKNSSDKDGDWAPGIAAADELAKIAKGQIDEDPPVALLEPFIESMRKLAGEEAVMNRAARRKLIAAQPRARRLSIKAPDLIIPARTLH